MKILIVNRYFFPDEAATSRMSASLAVALARSGHDVHVLASRCYHDDQRPVLPARDDVEGVSVHRIWTTRFGRHVLAGRAVDYLSFHVSAAWRLFRLIRRNDCCVACTDPPFLSVSVLVPVLLRRGVLINWIMDLFPEVPIALNMVRPSGPAARMALWLRDLSLRKARWNVAPIGAMAELLQDRGIPEATIAVVHHWSDGDAIRPLPRAGNRFRAEWGLEDRFVVGYSGNLGRAHEFGTILDAAERLSDRPEIIFLIVGEGYRRDRVEAEVRRRGLRNVVLKPLQPRDLLGESLAAADVHLVSLLPEMEPYIVPSKFYGIAAAGRPTLFVGDPEGEIARLVRRGDCGAAVPVGGSEELAGLILDFVADPARAARLGANARRLFEAEFTETRGIREWGALVSDAAPHGRRSAVLDRHPGTVAS